MKYFKSITQSDGSVNYYPWSLSTSIGLSFTSIIIKLIIISLISALVPLFCLLIQPISIPKHRLNQAILGVLASIIWTIDYSFGVFSWHIFHEYPDFYSGLTTINLIILFLHLIVTYLDEVIDEISNGFLVINGASFLIIYYTYPKFHEFFKQFLVMSDTSIF